MRRGVRPVPPARLTWRGPVAWIGFIAIADAIIGGFLPEVPAQDAIAIEVVKPAAEAVEKDETEKFPPAFEKVFQAMLDKCAEARKEQAREEFEESVAAVAEFAGLSKAKTEQLREKAEKSIETSIGPWKEQLDKLFRGMWSKEMAGADFEDLAEEILQGIEDAGVEEIVEEMPSSEKGRPDRQPEWDKALQIVLSPDQLRAWKKKQKEEQTKAEEQFAKILDNSKENHRRQSSLQIYPVVDDIVSTVGLDEKRAEKLKAAADAALDEFMVDWEEQARDYLIGLDPQQQNMMMQRGMVSIGLPTDKMPQKQPAWLKGIKQILSDAEQEQWERALARREQRRARAATMIFVTVIDNQIALTAEQRKKLEPIIARSAVKGIADRLSQENWGRFNFSQIGQYAEQVDQSEIEAVLDDIQMKRWKEHVIKRKESTNRAARPKKAVEEKAKNEHLPGPDPVFVERAVSQHLYKMMLKEREQVLSLIQVNAEDAARVASLNLESQRQLSTAAKGAAEEEIGVWSNNINQWVRQSLQGATPANVEERLRNLSNVRFGRQKKAEDSEVWKSAMSTLLTEEQHKKWKSEQEARKSYRWSASSNLIMAQLDAAARLTPDQIGKLEPLLEASVKKYGPDIDRYFSSWNNDAPWYLNSYYNMIPFEGIPEKEAKGILNKQQWKVWEEKFRARVSNYWPQVIQYHDQRTKTAEKK